MPNKGKELSHKEIMLWNSRAIRAKVTGLRELFLTLISTGLVPPTIEKRFRELDALDGKTMKAQEEEQQLTAPSEV